MGVTCVPYLIAWWFTPRDGVFPGILFNSDDHGVYFAWMRQARDGHLLFRNLFTTEPQRGVYFHLYFLLLGWLSNIPGISIPLAYHLGRLFFGITTLVLVYRLGAFFTPDLFARRCIFWTAAVSAGFGWLFWSDRIRTLEPVDVWQPEALIFPSLYTNSLFAVSLALMLGVVVCLLLAESRGPRWAVLAGLCGLVLGNIHSYDVIHLTLVWVTYLGLRWIMGRRFPAKDLGLALIAAVVAAPSVAYMAWLYVVEPVFKARADTATWSRSPLTYLLGYGLLVPLAVWGGFLLWNGKEGEPPDSARRDRLRRLLPPAWAVAGLVAAYLPFAFQRKMIMGYHIPLALLAGLAVAEIGRRALEKAEGMRKDEGGRLKDEGGRLKDERDPLHPSSFIPQPFEVRRAAPVVSAALLALMAISNVRFLVRDASQAKPDGITSTSIHPVYWPESGIHAFEWLGRSSPRTAALLTWPMNGVLAPAYSGRAVYAGHWGETPRFPDRVTEAFRFYWGIWNSEERLRFLRANGITHVLLSPMDRSYMEAQALGYLQKGRAVPPPRPLEGESFLLPVFREGEAVLFQVR
jgi:hypothetical protein